MTDVITLTKLEEQVLLATLAFWNYGDETEKQDNAVMFSLNDLRAEMGLPLNCLKGVVGSLFKKSIFCEMVGGEIGNQVEIGITDEGIDEALQLIREKDALV
jgi:hypothetical protein